jgi:predicted acetyltransferase
MGPGNTPRRRRYDGGIGMSVITSFLDPGELSDGNLRLVLRARVPASPEKGWVPMYRFDITVSGERVGGIDFRLGASDFITRFAGQIGYGIDERHRGHRYAARAVRLLTSLARAHGLSPLWITCNPENVASRRTCELAGAELVEIVDLPRDCDMYLKGDRRKCRYRLAL